MSKLMQAAKKSFLILCQIWKVFEKENLFLRASSLTLTSLLNLVPLMVVIFSAFSIFPFFDQLSVKVQTFIFENFVPSAGATLQNYFKIFESQAHQLPIVTFLFLFLTVALLMYNIETHLNEIFRVSKRRRFSEAVLLYWGMLTLVPIFLGLSLVLSSYITSLEIFSGEWMVGARKLWILLPPFAAFLGFGFLYVTVPHVKVSWRYAALGAFVAMVLFEIAKFGFALYLKFFPTYALIYGALAVVPIFMVWVYVSWVLFLVGALIAAKKLR